MICWGLEHRNIVSVCLFYFVNSKQTSLFSYFQVALERETGVVNGDFSNDMLFLRQLILDGNWDATLDFIEPLRAMSNFDYQSFKYFVIKYKFFELLCIKNEPTCSKNNEFTVEE